MSRIACQPVRMANLGRWLAWLARLAWLLVAIVGGSAIEQAVDSRSDAVRLTAGVGCWAGWAIVTLALLIASVRTLTVVRVGVPLAAGVTLAAALAGADALSLLSLGAPATVAIISVFSAEFGRWFVQASAYGDEERFPLRPPAAVAIAAVATWLVWAGCVLTGPLLVAARSWVAGAVLTILAITGLVLLGPRWHRLTRRWLVFVPAGLVLHDPVVMADTVSLRSAQVAGIRLAPRDTEAADLTGPASGYALEVQTTQSITVVFAFTPSEPNGRAIHLTAFLVCPSRPGSALAAAARRGLPVG